MDTLFICTNIQCSVYVYGSSSEVCPDCGLEGLRMSMKQASDFTQIYLRVQNPPAEPKVPEEESITPRSIGGIKWGEDLEMDCKEMQKLEAWGILPPGHHYNNCSLH